MRKPKIFATLGNTTDSNEVIAGMIKAGMFGARINTAYCDFSDYKRRIDLVKEEAEKVGVHIPIMMDIDGPQLRILTANPKLNYTIREGMVFPLGFKKDEEENKEDKKKKGELDIFLNHDLKEKLNEGDTILIENGTIITRVLENDEETLLEVINQGEGNIRDHMGVNIPRKNFILPHLSEKDKEVIDFSLKLGLDYIALSYGRDQEDVDNLQEHILSRKRALKIDTTPGIYIKIEDRSGSDNIDKIIEAFDKTKFAAKILFARGDYFNEVNYAKLASAQYTIAEKCKRARIPFMIGSGFLESMKYNSRPTRAEIGDIWNALSDKPDELLLTAETSNSKYPVLAVTNLEYQIDRFKKPAY